MGIKFGEIDANQILENEFRIGTLERIFDWLLSNNVSIKKPSQQDILTIRQDVVEKLKKKYPNSGIEFNG